MSVLTIKCNNQAEWLENRKNGIGSSEIATIIGLNRWETPYQLWRRKVGLDPEKVETMPMRLGHLLEGAVAQLYSEETGREIEEGSDADFICISKEKPFLRVSPDRFVNMDGERAILECKTTQMPVDEDEVPEYWFAQLQYQMGVAEIEQGSIAWLQQGRDFGFVDYKLVPEFYAYLAEQAERFWVDNIKGGKEPEAYDASDVLAKYGIHTAGKAIEVGDDVYEYYNSLKGVRDEIAELEARKATLEDEIKKVFKDAEAISYNGFTLATWKAPKPSKKFDQKRFSDEHPELVNQYMIESQGSRRFLLK